MNAWIARHKTLATCVLLTLAILLFLLPALRPETIQLAANLPFLVDPLWQPLAPTNALSNANPILGDQFYQFHAWLIAAKTMLANGELPLWNPAIYGGQPLYGNGLSGILSPFNVGFYFLPANIATLLSIFLRLWIAGFFTYLYSRAIGLSLAASWLAMLTFAFSGPLIHWLLGTPSHVMAWIPALLWVGEQLLSKRTLRWQIIAATFLALLIFSSQPELAFQTGLFWGIYLLIRATMFAGGLWQALRTYAPMLGVVLLLGVGMAAVEILAFVEALSTSIIWHDRQAESFPNFLHWLQRIFLSWQEWPTVVTTLLPNFLGLERDQSDWFPVGNSIENNAYAGVLPLLLALLALIYGWRTASPTTRRWLWLWGSIAIAALAIALKFPLVALIQDLPPFNVTHMGRLRAIYVFAISILAAFGLDLLRATPALRRPFTYLLVGALLTNLVLVATAYIGFTLFADHLIASGRAFMQANMNSPMLDRPLDELYALVETRQLAKLALLRPSNPIMFLPVWIGLALFGLHWLQRQYKLTPSLYLAALIGLTTIDLQWAAAGVNTVVPTAWLNVTPAPITYLQAQSTAGELSNELRDTLNNEFRVVGTNLTLNPNMSMYTQLEDVRGYDAVASHRYRQLLNGMDGYVQIGYHSFFSHLDDPRLDLLNAVYGLSRTPPTHERWEPVPNATGDSEVKLYRSRTALPRAYVVYDAQIAATPKESLARTLSPTFVATQSVILEEMPANWVQPTSPPSIAPTITLNERRATTLEFTVRSATPAIFVLLETYTPGWQASINEQPVPLYVANHAFRAVVIPAGEQQLRLTYAPPLFFLGAKISLTMLIITLLLYLWSVRIPLLTRFTRTQIAHGKAP